MNELLLALPQGARVLDIGCGAGSFPAREVPFTVVQIDLDRARASPGANFVQADAAMLPFPARSFDLIVSPGAISHGMRRSPSDRSSSATR